MADTATVEQRLRQGLFYAAAEAVRPFHVRETRDSWRLALASEAFERTGRSAEALAVVDEICRREGTSINDLVGLIDRQRRESKLTAAIRVFVMAYYRAASTDEGHVGAGHGILRHAAASAESRTPKKKPTGPGKK